MGAWPELRESRTVRAGRESATVVRCSLTDVMLADLPVSVVFFYRETLDTDRLAEGLAVALAHVPVFAGRLRPVGDGLEIVCDDSGVPMNSYDVDESLGEAMGRVTLAGSGYAEHVDAPRARGGGDPLLTVRVSRLAGGGTALGCSWHHAVGDMLSFMVLMRAWSAAVEGTPLPETAIVGDRDAYLEDVLPRQDSGRPGFRLPDAEDAAGIRREFETALRANRTVQVYFSDEEVARMREKFTASAGRRLSTNDVLCGHLVSTIRGLAEDTGEARSLAMPVNIRKHLGIPADMIGNLVSEVFLTAAPNCGPEALAVRIRTELEDFTRSHLSIRANHAFIGSLDPERLRDCVPVGFDPTHRTFTVSNWSRFGVYDIAFGGRRPAFFSPAADLQLPWISWLVEGFDNTGFLLTVVVPSRLALRMRSEAGSAALHRFRETGDTVPALAGSVRKLI
jgi:hypothetical protein